MDFIILTEIVFNLLFYIFKLLLRTPSGGVPIQEVNTKQRKKKQRSTKIISVFIVRVDL